MRTTKLLAGMLVAAVSASPLAAQGGQAPASGWRAEFLGSLGTIERKYVALAEAMPQDRYAWRPAPGVRSVCEVYLHVAVANYLSAVPLGAKTPTDVNVKTMEQCPSDKAQVVSTIKASFAHFRDAVASTPEGDADTAVTLFGMNMTKRGMLLFTAEHLGEHLGQSIAYARSNGVVPPWSARGGD